MRYSLLLIVYFMMPFICNAQTTWYVPDDFTTIQGGISDVSVSNGDTIIVRAGTYVENIDFLGKLITVKSEDGPATTTIDGNQTDSVVIFQSGELANAVLDGFTLTNGTGNLDGGKTRGGGIYCVNSSSPTIRNNTITGNSADLGAGIYPRFNSSPQITKNLITNNTALVSGGGMYCWESSPEITDNIISFNVALTEGGAMLCNNFSSPVIKGNTIEGNTSTMYGGGIEVANNCAPIVDNNIIKDNATNTWMGGGVFFTHDCSGTITNNTISGNFSVGAGGGICCYESSPLIEGNTISDNTTETEGAGIMCFMDASPTIRGNTIMNNVAERFGGGVEAYDNCNPIIERNLIMGNTATVYGGGGILVSGYCGGTITKNIIAGNTSSGTTYSGGGLLVDNNSTSVISDNIIHGNSSNTGGGMDCTGAFPILVNNSFIGNSSDKGGGIACRSASNMTISNTILWNNSASDGPEMFIGTTISPSTVTISYSDVKGGISSVEKKATCTLNWGSGMIDLDPLFVDPLNDDYHLTYNSPCMNGGDNNASYLPALDFEDDPRISDGTADMGADEFHPHLYYTGDATPSGPIQVKCIGEPGSVLNGIIVGVNIFDPPLPCDYGLWYMNDPMLIMTGFGLIPSDGVYVINGTIPATPPGPYTVYLQAAIDSWLTNLCAVNVK